MSVTFTDINQVDTAPAWRYLVVLPDLQSQKAPPPIRASAVTLPFPFVDVQSIFRGGRHIQLPDSYALDTLDITLLETPDWKIAQYLQAWRLLQMDENGLWGMPADYKKVILIYPMTHQGDFGIGFRYTNCQPSRAQPINLDGKTSDVVHQNLSFPCDRFSIDGSTVSTGSVNVGPATVPNALRGDGIATQLSTNTSPPDPTNPGGTGTFTTGGSSP